MSSPTQRSLALLREQGFHVEIVEHYHHYKQRKTDLFGFADLLAIRPGEIRLVQTTTSDHLADRVHKIESSPLLDQVRAAGFQIHAHGWKKYAQPVDGKWWRVRVVELNYP